MLPSVTTAPKCSLQTASSIRADLRLPSTWRRAATDVPPEGAQYTGLPSSPKAAHRVPPPHKRARAWLHPARLLTLLHAFPQTSFLLFVIGCTCASGLHVSSQLAHSLLSLLRVPHAVALAQQRYALASAELQNATSCVTETSLALTAALQASLRAYEQQATNTVAANAAALDRLEDRVSACSSHFIRTINASSPADRHSNVSSAASSATHECFVTRVFLLDNTTNARTHKRSREILDHVRLVLLSQALPVAETPALRLPSASAAMLHAISTVFDSVQASLGSAGAQALATSDNSTGLTILDALHRDTDSPSLVDAFVPTGVATTALDALRTKLQQRLRSLSPTQRAMVARVLNTTVGTVVDEWRVLEQRVRELERQSVELQHAANSSWTHMHESIESTRTMLTAAKAEAIDSVRALDKQWTEAAQGVLLAQEHKWRVATEHLRALYDSLGVTQSPMHKRRHCRDLGLDNGTINADAVVQRHDYLIRRRHELLSKRADRTKRTPANANTSASAPVLFAGTPLFTFEATRSEVHTALGAGLDLMHVVETFIWTLDWGRVIWSILDVAVALWTDSYSVVTPIDIRGITSIQNLSDAWTILQCKHDAKSVVYFVVKQADVLVQLVIEYVVWIAMGVVGTGALAVWKRDFASVCSDAAADQALDKPPTLAQVLLSAVLPIRASVWDPIHEVASQATFTEQVVQRAHWRIANASNRAYANQTAALEHLEAYESTLASLLHVLAACASEHNGGLSSDVSTACAHPNEGNIQGRVLQPPPAFPSALLNASSSVPLQLMVGEQTPFAHCFPTLDVLPAVPTSGSSVPELHRLQACAAEHALYLTVASWWLFCIVWSMTRFVARMAITASGLAWWRALSARRLEFIGYCYEDGAVFAPESLPQGARDRLCDVRWLIRLRVCSVLVMIASCVLAWFVVLHQVL